MRVIHRGRGCPQGLSFEWGGWARVWVWMRIELLHRVAAGQDGMVTRAQALRGRSDPARDPTAAPVRLVAAGLRGYFYLKRSRADSTRRRAANPGCGPRLGPGAFGCSGRRAGVARHRRSAPDTDEIHVSVPGRSPRPQRSLDAVVAVHQLTVGPGDSRPGVRASRLPARFAPSADVILRVDRYPAVSVLDSALNRGSIDPEDLAAIPSLIRGRRGAVRRAAVSARRTGGRSRRWRRVAGCAAWTAGCRRTRCSWRCATMTAICSAIGDLGWRGPG